MTRWLRRLAHLLRRRQAEAELVAELEAHRRLKQDALERSGLTPAEARAASRRALGNVTLAREDARGVWLWHWLESFVQDLRYGIRMLGRRPGFTVVAAATLAVGLGTTTAVYSIADAVLWQPVPFGESERLVQIVRRQDARQSVMLQLPETDYLRVNSRTLDVGSSQFFDANLSGGDLPQRVRGVRITPNLLPLLGVEPILGAVPQGARAATHDAPVVVISYALWQTWFGGAPDAPGRLLRVNGRDHLVAAVMPEHFRFPAPYWAPGDLWVPAAGDDPAWRQATGARLAFGRVRTDVSPEQASAELQVLSADLARLHPDSHRGIDLGITAYGGPSAERSRPHVLLLLAAAGLVLLIVGVNVLNLLLGRGFDRRREMAARAALGAGRLRLIRQLATETLLLFAIGGTLGLVLARWTLAMIGTLRSWDIPRMEEAAIDGSAVLFAVAVTLATALVVAAVPAWQLSKVGVAPGARGDRGQSAGRRARLLQRTLVVAEVSLALILVAAGGLLVQSYRNLSAIDPGFEAAGLWHARISLPPARYPTVQQQSTFFRELGARLRNEPGIAATGVADLPPGVGAGAEPAFLLPGDPQNVSPRDRRAAAVRIIDAHCIDALGVRVLAGRGVSERDLQDQPFVALVNETFARELFDDGMALGQRVLLAASSENGGEMRAREIVGVVSDIKEATIHQPAPPTVYVPLAQQGATNLAVLIRTSREIAGLETILRRHTASLDPERAVLGFRPMHVLIEGELTLHRLNTVLLSGFALTSLALAVIGVFGVTAHAVRQRTREIGIRLALGLAPADVLRMILREGLWMAAAGIAIGVGGAVWAGRLLQHLLYGVPPADIGTLIVASGAIGLAVTLACLLPARRAAKLDPVSVLRE